MGDSEDGSNDMIERMQSLFGNSSSSMPKQTLTSNNHPELIQMNPNQFRSRPIQYYQQQQFSCGDSNNRVGIPPSHSNQIPPISPFSQIPVSRPGTQKLGSHKSSSGPTHSRSLSQPSALFSFDSLPPLSPTMYRDPNSIPVSDSLSTDVSMEDRNIVGLGLGSGSGSGSHSLLPPSSPFTRVSPVRSDESLQPRKAHRRSNSDVSFNYNSVIQSSPPLVPLRSPVGVESKPKPVQLVKKESFWDTGGGGGGGGDNNSERMNERKSEGEVVDDLFTAYMNLDNIDALNSSGTDDKNGEDLDSRASVTKTNGCESSDNEAESSVYETGNNSMGARTQAGYLTEKREGVKRSAGGDAAPTTRHYRSLSMDSFMGKMNFDDSLRPPPSPGSRPGQLSPSNSIDTSNSAAFSLEFGNGEFSGAELKKIMANDKLSEIALNDPKRAKRILANRQSAARSKERKMRYISELEQKVQTLQTEATTLSTQVTLLQRDSGALTNENKELKFRLQAMEQQAQLRDALHEALTGEVRRLKISAGEINADSDNNSNGMHSVNVQMFPMQHQAAVQHNNIHQLQQRHHQQPPLPHQQQQQQQQQNGNTTTKTESHQ